MKKSSKAKLKNGLLSLLFLAVLSGLIIAAVKFAPEDPTAGATFLNDVADRHRY